jgi:hypothetical protein
MGNLAVLTSLVPMNAASDAVVFRFKYSLSEVRPVNIIVYLLVLPA